MHTTTSALTLLLAGSSAVADAAAPRRRSLATADHVRSLGMKAIHRSLAIARKTQGAADLDLDDLMAVFGGDEGGGLGALLCMDMSDLMGGVEGMEGFEDMEGMEGMEDMEGGLVCSTPACDATQENLFIQCSVPSDSEATAEPICVDYEETPYCITGPTISINIGLDLANPGFRVEQCGTYIEPDFMKQLGKGCGTVHLNMDLGSLMGDMMGGGGEMTEEEAAALAADVVQVQECSVNFEGDSDEENDDTACKCTICNEGMGFELICDEGLDQFTQECLDYDASALSALDGGEPDDEISFSVMRLVQIPADGTVSSDTQADPAVADPADPTVADPADPAVADPADPAVADPADPTAADPADPSVADPADTTDADPAGAGTLDSPAAYHTGALGAGLVILSASLFTMM